MIKYDKPQTQMVYTRISKDLHRALQEQARADRRTLAATMALALEEFIERHAPRDVQEKGAAYAPEPLCTCFTNVTSRHAESCPLSANR